MNVKKAISLVFFGALALLIIGCGGGDPTRTPTHISEAAAATQTPWIIYVPVTVTPVPATATLEATVTPNEPPTAVPTETRPPATPRPVQPTQEVQATAVPPTAVAAAESPTAPPPPASPVPSCGSQYQVTNLFFPEDGALREAKPGGGAGKTIQFRWTPVSATELDPTIGYRVSVSTKVNSTALYISHNDFLVKKQAVLSQQATYGLTLGDDSTATWFVEVIKAGEFDPNDETKPPLGDVVVCGPPSPTFNIFLHVV